MPPPPSAGTAERLTPARPASHAEPVELLVRGRPLHAEEELPDVFRDRAPSEMEHRFTSTGIKFWKHREAMESHRAGTGRTVISTHVAPEGRCNLTCDYCSVTHRTFHSRLELPVVIDYLTKLKSRGLKAVILTGGGEPTIYKHFNELGEWILDAGLEMALITNGTMFRRVSDRILANLTWCRVSMNRFDGWEKKIQIPMDRFGARTTVGMSLCFSGDNRELAFLKRVGEIADAAGVEYVRVLPDCMLRQADLLKMHEELDRLFAGMTGGHRFFHQFKIHGAPRQARCHQSFFRPYLSEEVDPETGRAGLVFPCDSVVLNDQAMKFKAHTYALCPPERILDYLDGKIPQRFDATQHCTGCVFTRNVNMLDDYVRGSLDGFEEFAHTEVNHANFV